jgi:antitoxin component YwqK of YwqJK toxin-antitoxin module
MKRLLHRLIVATVLTLLSVSTGLAGSSQGAVTLMKVNADAEGLAHYQGSLYLDGVGFTGVLVSEYPDGGARSEIHYINGLRDGDSNRWYVDGSKSSRTVFVAGLREGDAIGWWPNGQMQFIRSYSTGLLEGESLEWNENGQLRYRQNFTAGQEDGLQQGWHDDGEPSFAYEYRDGRRYGVLGSKPCFTVTTDARETFNENL